ncbi:hypothetical protein M422DRAFT_181130, partial [Sphaerobolus stellatus SS14]
YCQIPTFGRDTICCFLQNVSELKKLAARDFEALQCALPIFEGLFQDPHEGIIRMMLFTLCEWHGLMKLQMHTNATLECLESATSSLGTIVRKIAVVTCPQFDKPIGPLQHTAFTEFKACKHHLKNQDPKNVPCTATTMSKKKKSFNLQTPKFHLLRDYAPTIRWMGSTTGYSTQMVNCFVSARAHGT